MLEMQVFKSILMPSIAVVQLCMDFNLYDLYFKACFSLRTNFTFFVSLKRSALNTCLLFMCRLVILVSLKFLLRKKSIDVDGNYV